jgi:hypothetical protein
MIHYNVWFSFQAGVDEAYQLEKTRHLLDDLKSRGMIADYRLLRSAHPQVRRKCRRTR